MRSPWGRDRTERSIRSGSQTASSREPCLSPSWRRTTNMAASFRSKPSRGPRRNGEHSGHRRLRRRRAAGAGAADCRGERDRQPARPPRGGHPRGDSRIAGDRSRRASPAEHVRDPLRGLVGRSAAHPPRPRGRRGLGGQRVLKRHDLTVGRIAGPRPLGGAGEERRAVLPVALDHRAGDRARRRDRRPLCRRDQADRGRARVIIECDRCYARYRYDESRFEGKSSKKVRCTKCLAVFEIYNTPAFEAQATVPPDGDLAAPEWKAGEDTGRSKESTTRKRAVVSARPAPAELKLPPDAKLSLAVISGPDAGKIFPIGKPRVVIGRQGADINLD